MFFLLFFINFFNILILISNPLSSEEAETKTVCLAELHGEPSAFVNGVNVITGSYCVSDTDLYIHGPSPMVIRRSYSSRQRMNQERPMFEAWECNNFGSFCVTPKDDYCEATCHTGSDGPLLYVGKPNENSSEYSKLRLCRDELRKGMTNNDKGVMIGFTDKRNNHALYKYTGKIAKKIDCDGTVFHFKHYDKLKIPDGNRFYRIDQETSLCGYRKKYLYQSEMETASVLQMWSPAGHLVGEYTFDRADRNSVKKNHKFEIKSSDGRKVTYLFTEHYVKGYSGEGLYLSYVIKPNAPMETFTYIDDHHMMSQRSFPKGRYIKIDYYRRNANKVAGKTIDIDTKDVRYHRVKELKAPVGSGKEAITTHSFVYHLRTKGEGSRVATGGYTKVYDALNRKTTYRFSDQYRIEAIEKYLDSGEKYCSENLYWGSGRDQICLKSRTFSDGNDNIIFCRSYYYDDKGNVLKDRLYGNLTGENHALIKMKGYRVENNGAEYFEKRFSYTPKNLINCEWDNDPENGELEVCYSYKGETNLISAKLVKVNGGIYTREFYFYDNDNLQIGHITDNGTTVDPNNLTGVTERRIKRITPLKSTPFGFPAVIDELYYDTELCREVLLKRTKNQYSIEGNVLSTEVFDGNLQSAYTHHWEYNRLGKKVREVNALGEVTTRRFDSNGNLVFEQGPNEKYSKSFVYDYSNRLIRENVVTVEGEIFTKSYTYDFVGNCISSTDQYGNVTKNEYDEFGRLVRKVFPQTLNGSGNGVSVATPVQEYKYDHLGNVVYQKDISGQVVVSTYNIRNDVLSRKFSDGTSESYTYYLNGLLKEKIGRDRLKTVYIYDALKRPVSRKIYSLEGVFLSEESWVYNAFHVIEECDPEGVVTSYEYDGAGRLVQVCKGNSKTCYLYDSLGRKSHTINYYSDTEAKVTAFEYDLVNQVIEERIEDLDGVCYQKKNFRYNCDGKKIEEIHYQNDTVAISTFAYNAFGQIEVVRDPAGIEVHTHYDYEKINGLSQKVMCQTTIDPYGTQTIVEYDVNGRERIYEKKNALGSLLQRREMFYDLGGNCVKVVESVIGEKADSKGEKGGKGQKASSSNERIRIKNYDVFGREVEDIQAVGTAVQTTVRTSYDFFGRKSSVVKADGVVIEYAYDGLGRMLSQRSSDGSIDDYFEYDRNGNVVRVEDRVSGLVTERTYDENRRIIREVLGNGVVMSYVYDGIGRVIQVILPDETTIDYGYDVAGLRDVCRGRMRLFSDAQYDMSGRLTSAMTRVGEMSYEYDVLGRVKELSSPYYRESLSYDLVGNIVERVVNGQVDRYGYDNLNQLVAENEVSYSYDSLYNRLSKGEKEYQVNAKNQILDDGESAYVYDLNGNRVEKRTGGAVVRYGYDALNRLKSVFGWVDECEVGGCGVDQCEVGGCGVDGCVVDGCEVGGCEFSKTTDKVEYVYDSADRRLRKDFYRKVDGVWVIDHSERYLYHENCEIGMINEEGKILELRILGHGRGGEIGASIGMEIDGLTYIPVHDHNGNIVQLLSIAGSASGSVAGSVVENYDLNAFGEESDWVVNEKVGQRKNSETFGKKISPWRFSSKRVDTETGLVYYGKRFYDPKIGRWLTADPIGYLGGVNLYGFVSNNPLVQVDYFGLLGSWQHSLGCMAAYAVGTFLHVLGDHTNIEYLSKAIAFAGHTLMNGMDGSFVHSSDWSPSSENKVGNASYSDKETHVYGNGIMTSKKAAQETAEWISKQLGGSTVRYVHSASYGFMADMLTVLRLMVGLPTASDRLLAKTIRESIAAVGGVGGGGKVNVWVHSRGGLVLHRALGHLTAEEKKMLHVKTFGSAKMISMEGLGSAINYVCRRDGVPFIADPFGHIRGMYDDKVKIEYLESNGWPLVEHGVAGVEYRGAMQVQIDEFCERYGVKK